MPTNLIRVVLDDGAFLPERAHLADAGYDLRTPVDFTISSDYSVTIDTGVHIQIPEGYVGFLKSKSGLNVRCGITGEGVIDSGYTGSIRVKLYCHADHPTHFKRGDKIIQLILLPIYTPELVVVHDLEATDRGDNGFGSTGR